MPEPDEIVPGRSVGPVALGMTRDEVRALGLGACKELADGSGLFFPRAGADPHVGITAQFDAAGRCSRVEAFFGAGPPLYRLRGRVVNELPAEAVAEIIQEITPDVRRSYGSIEAPAAGISGTKWESGDLCLCSVEVFPPA